MSNCFIKVKGPCFIYSLFVSFCYKIFMYNRWMTLSIFCKLLRPRSHETVKIEWSLAVTRQPWNICLSTSHSFMTHLWLTILPVASLQGHITPFRLHRTIKYLHLNYLPGSSIPYISEMVETIYHSGNNEQLTETEQFSDHSAHFRLCKCVKLLGN